MRFLVTAPGKGLIRACSAVAGVGRTVKAVGAIPWSAARTVARQARFPDIAEQSVIARQALVDRLCLADAEPKRKENCKR